MGLGADDSSDSPVTSRQAAAGGPCTTHASACKSRWGVSGPGGAAGHSLAARRAFTGRVSRWRLDSAAPPECPPIQSIHLTPTPSVVALQFRNSCAAHDLAWSAPIPCICCSPETCPRRRPRVKNNLVEIHSQNAHAPRSPSAHPSPSSLSPYPQRTSPSPQLSGTVLPRGKSSCTTAP